MDLFVYVDNTNKRHGPYYGHSIHIFVTPDYFFENWVNVDDDELFLLFSLMAGGVKKNVVDIKS